MTLTNLLPKHVADSPGHSGKLAKIFFPFPQYLIMMRKNFQFCFCKKFEDNKIPYQKLLIVSTSLPLSCHMLSTPSADNRRIF